MRLVNADSIMERKFVLYDTKDITHEEFEALVNSEPTAYDVEQVKEELKIATRIMMPVIPTEEALGIVEKGGISNANTKGVEEKFCEWKKYELDSLFPYKTSCGKSDLYDDEYKHCPYCGKIIKLV